MAKIYIKGENQPQTVPREEAERILEEKNDVAHKGTIRVGTREITKGQIKEIRFDEDIQKTFSAEQVKDFERQFKAMEEMARAYPIHYYGNPLRDQEKFPGMVINPVLGAVHWSIVQHALESKAISKFSEGRWQICGLVDDSGNIHTEKYDNLVARIAAVRTLGLKREYAREATAQAREEDPRWDETMPEKVDEMEINDNLPF